MQLNIKARMNTGLNSTK